MDNEAIVTAIEALPAAVKAKLDALEKKALTDGHRARLASALSSLSALLAS
jgi:hypothetical protein